MNRNPRRLGILQEVPGEDYKLTGSALSFDGVRPAIRNAAPRLGTGTAEALASARQTSSNHDFFKALASTRL